MVELTEFTLLVLCVFLSLASLRVHKNLISVRWLFGISKKPLLSIAVVGGCTLLGCFAVSALLHEPIPRTADEFSYLLMSDTFSSGRVTNPAPPLPEFFDTLHVLVQPGYVSKYYAMQGIFLAIGQKLTGHPAVGLWLSSALACAAVCWMLQSWVGSTWGLLGGLLMTLQYGVFSYWSQSYWGGMAAALGGALFFGAVRHLWDQFAWPPAVCAACGIVILVNSRPTEGLVVVLPITILFIVRSVGQEWWKQAAFWKSVGLPAGLLLVTCAWATGAYNRAITGSALTPPYLLHEQQYQESPPFIFLPQRPKLNYSSRELAYYYQITEVAAYQSQRRPALFACVVARKLKTWWDFYCGIILSVPLILPCLQRRGWSRNLQIAFLLGLGITALIGEPRDIFLSCVFDVLFVGQIALLWIVFEEFWPRLAIGTCSILLLVSLTTKWAFPHYFAPAACLVLYLQIEGLCRVWHWRGDTSERVNVNLTRAEKRRMAKTNKIQSLSPAWRNLVVMIPVLCLICLGVRITAPFIGWEADPHGPDNQVLLLDDWSLHRANIQNRLEQQTKPQLVFVRYSPQHNVYFEWVFNRADIVHAKVVWARDFGVEHNRLLLKQFPDRDIWFLDADGHDAEPIPYSEAIASSSSAATNIWKSDRRGIN